jgi:2'-5' RNA ligase
MKMIRSFIAIEIENQELLDRISTLQRTLGNTGANIKFVKPENVHITLKFLGEVPSPLIEMIGNHLQTLRFEPFNASLHGVGVFPSVNRINVVWLGITKGIPKFLALYRQIESQLQTLGISPDHRGFNPHVTIARLRSAQNKKPLVQVILGMKDCEFGIFTVNSVKLKKSVLTPQGPRYTTLMDIRARVKSAETMDEYG